MTKPDWLAPLLALCFTLTGCSSSGDGTDKAGGSAASAKQAFATAVNAATRQWAATAAPKHFTDVTSGSPNGPAIAADNKNSITADLCAQLSRFREETQDLDEATALETEALQFAESSAVDSAATGLLQHALAAADPERSRNLNLLLVGPVYVNDPARQVNGVDVLQRAELLDQSGQLVVPATEYLKGRDPGGPYERYQNWFSNQPGLVVSAGTLTSGIRDELRNCAGRS